MKITEYVRIGLNVLAILMAGCFSVSILLYYLYNQNLESLISFKEKTLSKVQEIDSFDDSPSVKDGQIVWLSGILYSPDEVSIYMRDENEKVIRDKFAYSGNPIYLDYTEKVHTRDWNKVYEYEYVAPNAVIGNVSLDADFIRSLKIAPWRARTVEFSSSYRVEINVIEPVDISCIALYKNGKLQATGNKDPFLYKFAKYVSPEKLFRGRIKDAEASVADMFLWVKVFGILLLFSAFLCYLFGRIYTESTRKAWSLCLRVERTPLNKNLTYAFAAIAIASPWVIICLVSAVGGCSFSDMVDLGNISQSLISPFVFLLFYALIVITVIVFILIPFDKKKEYLTIGEKTYNMRPFFIAVLVIMEVSIIVFSTLAVNNMPKRTQDGSEILYHATSSI